MDETELASSSPLAHPALLLSPSTRSSAALAAARPRSCSGGCRPSFIHRRRRRRRRPPRTRSRALGQLRIAPFQLVSDAGLIAGSLATRLQAVGIAASLERSDTELLPGSLRPRTGPACSRGRRGSARPPSFSRLCCSFSSLVFASLLLLPHPSTSSASHDESCRVHRPPPRPDPRLVRLSVDGCSGRRKGYVPLVVSLSVQLCAVAIVERLG